MNNIVYSGALQVCEIHAERLRWAITTLSALMPLTPEKLQQLSAIDLAVFDQFIVRFSKLQDAMGAKLLPGVLALTQEQGSLDTFIDKLNRLEKIGALASVDQWLILREMRNQFAHDYPEDPEIQAGLLNKAFLLADTLLQSLEAIKLFAAPYINSSSVTANQITLSK